MIFKPYYIFETGCAAYLLGCGSLAKCAVVDARRKLKSFPVTLPGPPVALA